jgi:hypothetical protein
MRYFVSGFLEFLRCALIAAAPIVLLMGVNRSVLHLDSQHWIVHIAFLLSGIALAAGLGAVSQRFVSRAFQPDPRPWVVNGLVEYLRCAVVALVPYACLALINRFLPLAQAHWSMEIATAALALMCAIWFAAESRTDALKR